MTGGFNTGGFEDRFRVTRTDGQPIDPKARYLVLDYSGRDPSAVVAIEIYAASVKDKNPWLSADLYAALKNPENWPAQHD